MKNFATPHCHQQSLDTGSTIDSFAKRELELGTGYMTVTDHGTMGACRKVYDTAKQKGLTPILGLEGYFFDPECPILKKHGIENFKEYAGSDYLHVTLHFLDQQAYETAVRLLSDADKNAMVKFNERKPPFTWRDLEELGGTNTVVGSGCLGGMVQGHIFGPKRPDIAAAYYDRLKGMFKPGNFFVEVFPHRVSHDWVAAVYVSYTDGSKEQFAPWKKIRVDSQEMKAEEFAKSVARKKGPFGHLTAVMENRVWIIRDPKEIATIEFREEFVQNECSPLAPDGDVQWSCNKFMLIQAKKNKDPVLISDDSHFAYPDDKIVQDIRLQAGGRSWRFYSSYHRQSSDEAFKHFNERMGIDQATFEGWVENNIAWAERFKDFKFIDRKTLPTKFYPQDTLRHLHALIKKHGRMNWNDQQRVERLKSEIDLLHYNGTIDLLPYFFVAEEVCAVYESKRKLTGPGRGSAAGLLLTYLLGITHVDPLRYNLSRDRFLTIDRIKSGKLPDIDQDLPDTSILVDPEKGWLKERFGDHYAQISVDTTLKLKSSVKDVARVMHNGKVPVEIEKLTKRFEIPPQGISDRDFVFGYEGSDGWVEGSIERDEALKEYILRYPEEWKIVQQCLGIVRQKGRHASAYVIANEPIKNFIPLTTVSEVTVTQYDMRSVEAVGGIKMDYLGLNSLNDIGDAILLIQERVLGKRLEEDMVIDGKRVPPHRIVPVRCPEPIEVLEQDDEPEFYYFDVWDLPEDQGVFRDVCESKTETVFQFNTKAARQWLELFNHEKNDGHKALDSIESLAAFTALDRPGPLDYKVEGKHNMMQEYANRAKGKKALGELPVLNKLFPETYGVIVFQEQLQKAFQDIGGTSGLEANAFREHVGKKKMKLVIEDRKLFMPKAMETLGEKVASDLWQSMETFGQYGFNKSHAVCYSVIGYACAWLKHHYGLEWWCAVLRNADKNEIQTKFWRYCGHLILMPDVNKSGSQFQIEGDRIRAPISLLLGVGEAAHKQLCAMRPFTDVHDMCCKIVEFKKNNATTDPETGKVRQGYCALHSGVVSTLIVSGCMDSLFPAGMIMQEQIMAYARAMAKAQGKKEPQQEDCDDKYFNANQYERYQMRKSVLPSYSEALLPFMVAREEPGVIVLEKGRVVYQNEINERVKTVPFVSMKQMEKVLAQAVWTRPIEVAVAAYVVEDRRFKYQDNKDAAALTLEIEGEHYEFVRWPARNSKELPDNFKKQDYTGCVVVAILEKYKEDRPFSVIDVVMVQPPLMKKGKK